MKIRLEFKKQLLLGVAVLLVVDLLWVASAGISRVSILSKIGLQA